MERRHTERRGSGTALTLAQRTAIFFLYICVAWLLKGVLIDVWRLTADNRDFWFFALVGLLGFKLLSNPFFVPPSEALASSVAALFVLVTISTSGAPSSVTTVLETVRLSGVATMSVAIVSAILAILLKDADVAASPTRHRLGRAAYRMSDRIGRSEVAFTFPALISSTLSH